MTDDGTGSRRGRKSKVARLIEEYDLEGIGEKMERRWTADDDRWSLRDLADHFNQTILEAALEVEGAQLLNGEVENTYRLLTDDDVAEADKTRVRRRLERDGIEVEDLLDDFLSYQAIRTFLTKHQDAEYTPDDTDPVETATESLQRLRSRSAQVTESRVTQLRDSGHLALGEARVTVDVRVLCEDCGSQFDIGELLARQGCNCSEDVE